MFNRALWRKTFGESAILLVPCMIVLIGFTWMFVYLTNNMAIAKLPALLKYILPTHLLQLNSMRLEDWGTRSGVLSAIYIHPIVEFTCIVWAMVRGSAAVSGEISRGTMEMLLAQPVSRAAVVFVNGVTATIGAFLLPAATLVGLSIGLTMFPPREIDNEEPPAFEEKAPTKGMIGFANMVAGEVMRPFGIAQPAEKPLPEKVHVPFFVPSVLILACYTFCLCGICTLVSSWDHYRFRTIGIIGAWGVLQIVFDVAVRWVGEGNPLKSLRWLTIKTAFEPQRVLFCEPGEQLILLRDYCLVFVGIGLFAYLMAALIFSRRDLPTPL